MGKGRRLVAKLELRCPAKINYSAEVTASIPASIRHKAGVQMVMRSKRKKTT